MGMKHFIYLLSSCWEGVVVVELDPFMPRHRGWCVPSLHGSWRWRRECLAAAAREIILLALPCLAVQHNMHQMRWLVLQGVLFLTKTNESFTLDGGPGPTRLIFPSMNFLWNLPYPLWRSW